MSEQIDYRGIRETVNVTRVFEWLGLDMRPYGAGQLRGPCPMCNSRSTNSLVYTIAKESWCCQGRCEPRRGKKVAGGDIIDLVARMKDLKNPEAALLLEEQFLGNSSASRNRSTDHTAIASRRASVPDKRTQEVRQPRQNDSPVGMPPLDYLDPAHGDVEALGISVYEAEQLGAGYANRGVLRGLVAFPLRTEDGALVGYVGVAEGRVGKLHFPEQKIVPLSSRRRA